MRIFTDAKGGKWELDLNVAAMRRVRTLANVDLTSPQAPDPEFKTIAQKVVADVFTLCDVICAVCRPQAESRQITDEAFAALLGGTALGEAKRLLCEEWSDFFRNLGRLDQAAAVAKTVALTDAVGAEAAQQMDRLEKAILSEAAAAMKTGGDKALTQAMAQIRSGSGD